jgi:hypothetical protein
LDGRRREWEVEEIGKMGNRRGGRFGDGKMVGDGENGAMRYGQL